MSIDQKRAIFIIAVIAIMVIFVVGGVVVLASAVGLPLWIALLVGGAVAAAIGLFMVLNMI